MIEVPPVVRNRAVLAGANQWLDGLPDLIASLELEWGFEAGEVLAGGTEAVVLTVTLADTSPAVLKLLIPRSADDTASEITVLRLADGDGCARLLRADETRHAMLLERLGPSMYDLGLPLEDRHRVLIATASRLWRPAPESGLTTGAEKAQWLIDFITTTWETLDRPCSERAVEHALACAASRIAAHDDERAVLVHGDVHQWNALQDGDGFKLVDPDGLLAEPECDLGVMMREDPVELLDGDPRDRADRFAALSGLDATAIWEWGVVERVSTGLVCEQVGLQPSGRQMLQAADVIAASENR